MGGRNRRPGRVITRSAPVKSDPKRKRYTAYYWHEGKEISGGTFDTYEEAENAWLALASAIRRGTYTDPSKSRMLFSEFVELYRMLRNVDRSRTAMSQDSAIRTHLLPTFGDFQLREIDTKAIQAWMQSLQPTHSANSRKSLVGHLSGILTAAVQWDYISKHPCPGVKIPKIGKSRSQALEREEFDRIHAALPGPVSQLLVWLAANSGGRFGELTELRVNDVHNLDEDLPEAEWPEQQMLYLHFQRSVSDTGPEYGDDGGRFKIEETTKNGEDRKVVLDSATSDKVLSYIETFDLKDDDLLFPLGLFIRELETPPAETTPVPTDLGRTEPNANGRTYAHGTASAYGPGRCRCVWCRKAVAEYRAQRRVRGLDRKPQVGKRGRNLSEHLPRDTFRNRFWLPALRDSKVRSVRFHDLRHTHATWLARNGVDIVELQERMGHKRLRTTEIYIKKNRKPTTGAAVIIGQFMTKKAERSHRLRRAQAS